jgi:hypothetical protein
MSEEITRFDRPTAIRLRDLLISMLGVVATRMGLTVEILNGNFGESSYEVTFKFTVLNPATGAPEGFAADARRVGLPEDCWNQTFIGKDSKRYRIVGLQPRNIKYKLIAECIATKKRWRLPVAWALHEHADLG